jgi:hypothetical protein
MDQARGSGDRKPLDNVPALSAMHGLDPRDGVREQRSDITGKILSARLIVHSAVRRESRRPIGHVQPCRDQVARSRHGKNGPCTEADQRQRCSD